MLGRLRWLKRLLLDLPQQIKLVYCLLADPRVPVANKAAMGTALALIVSPLDLPAWLPVVGEMDAIALTLVATQLFIGTAPAEIVAEQQELVRMRRSRFDHDVERGRWLAVGLARRLGLSEPGADAGPSNIVLAPPPRGDDRDLELGA